MRSAKANAFSAYARIRLDAAVFVPDFGREDERLFAASLASTESLLAGLGEHRNAGGAALSVALGFVDVMTPNAFADWHKSGHVIGLHTALLVTMADFALYAFTQRGFLPLIGNADAETAPPPHFGEAPGLFLLDRTLQGSGIDAEADRHRVPNDAERHEAAIYLAVLMARFVWFHEWAHCALGHVDYGRAKGGPSRLHEIPDAQTLVGFHPQRADDELQLQHGMELEADRTALLLSLQIQLAEQEPVPGIQAFDAVTRVQMTVIAGLLMAWLFEEYQRHMDTRNAATHPAPRDRLHQLAGAAHDALQGSAIYGDVLASFAALRAHMPAMPDIGEPPPPLSDATGLETALAPFRYIRA